jgi:hypothetical protein
MRQGNSTSPHISGYVAAEGICWQFRNPGDRNCRSCPACSVHGSDKRGLALFGRCRSGRRWFWAAGLCFEGPPQSHGWVETEAQAIDAAMDAVRAIRRRIDKPVMAIFRADVPADKLKEINKAKRAARPAPDGSDARVAEYLYGSWYDGEDGMHRPYRFRITKKTAKRIYYIRPGEHIDDNGDPIIYPSGIKSLDREETGFVNRQKIETDGEVDNRGVHWCYPDSTLHISLQHLLAHIRRWDKQASLDLKALKVAMAAAHPDKGGTSAAFIAARKAYEAAKARMRRAS